MMRFRTVARPWAHFILCILHPFCRHWVFTSATRGYMKNVVTLFEPPKLTSRRVFETHRLSCSDFPKKFLRGGKPVSHLHLPKYSRAGLWRERTWGSANYVPKQKQNFSLTGLQQYWWMTGLDTTSVNRPAVYLYRAFAWTTWPSLRCCNACLSCCNASRPFDHPCLQTTVRERWPRCWCLQRRVNTGTV